MGLTLTLKELQELLVGDTVKILIRKVHVRSGKVRVTVDAPRELRVRVNKGNEAQRGDDDDCSQRNYADCRP
jgi:sRNA-binding carbon storage regulator CsrA